MDNASVDAHLFMHACDTYIAKLFMFLPKNELRDASRLSPDRDSRVQILNNISSCIEI